MIGRRAALLELGATALPLPARGAPAPPATGFVGLSYEKTQLRVPYFVPGNAALVRLYRQLGSGSLRIGANAVDTSSWRGSVSHLPAITPGQVDAFAGFVRRTGWTVIWGVNLARNTPAVAADEAAYVAQRLGPALQAIEIGNEPDLYAGNGARPRSYRFEDFLQEWRGFASAIRAAAPQVRLSGPASSNDLHGYTLPFAREAGPELALLTQHYYRANGRSSAATLDLLLRPDPALAEATQALAAAVRANAIPLGCRYAECNSFYGGGAPGLSRSYGTALWALDFLLRLAAAGMAGANLHGGGNGPGYTPIADAHGVVVAARPIFYGLLAFSQAGPGRVVPLPVGRADPAWVSAYAVGGLEGRSRLALVNKGPAAATVALPEGHGGRVAVLWLRGPALDAEGGVTLGGAAVEADGRWQPRTEALSLPAGTSTLTLPAASVAIVRPV